MGANRVEELNANIIDVSALFSECNSIIQNYATFTKGLQNAFDKYVKDVKKSARRPGAYIEPAFRLPIPPTIDCSSILPTNSFAMSKPEDKTEYTPPGSKPGRPLRGAALRARKGVAYGYKLESTTKLRRPSNFDPSKTYFHPLPTIPSTPDIDASSAPEDDVFKKPLQPVVAGSTKTRAGKELSTDESEPETKKPKRSKRGRPKKSTKKSKTSEQNSVIEAKRSRVAKRTADMSAADGDDCINSPHEGQRTFKKSRLQSTYTTAPEETEVEFVGDNPVETNSPTSKTKVSRNCNLEPSSPAVVANGESVEPVGDETKNSRTGTKTTRKNNMETSTAVVPEINIECVEPIGNEETMSSRTRTKTIRKNKVETSLLTVPVEINGEPVGPVVNEETMSSRTRTKTIRKNKVEAPSVDETVQMDATYVKPVEEPETNESNTKTKTLGKSSVVDGSSKLESARPVSPKETADGVVTDNDTEDTKQYSSPSKKQKRVISSPKKKTIKGSDPMDTLELPEGFLCFSPGQDRTKHPDTTNGPATNTVDELVSSIVQQNAPRTRSKMKALADSISKSEISSTQGFGKENVGSALPIQFIMNSVSDSSLKNTTPLATLNRMSPKAKTESAARNKPARFVKDNIKDQEKLKLAEARRKEEEAIKKKQELMQLKKQEIRKQRETKIKKVTELKAAVEKEKMLQLEKEKKEREEKEKQAKAEMMRLREEALLKKKLLNQQKAQEAEERRLKEEQLRLAKLKEQEEEQRKAAEARQRQVEEAERLAALRKQQQKEEDQARLLVKEKAKEKGKQAKVPNDTFNPNDFGILDDDCEEQENKPSRPVPKWAKKEIRTKQLLLQSTTNLNVVRNYFNIEPRDPNLREIFGRNALIRPRTSSAVWATPAPPPPSSP